MTSKNRTKNANKHAGRTLSSAGWSRTWMRTGIGDRPVRPHIDKDRVWRHTTDRTSRRGSNGVSESGIQSMASGASTCHCVADPSYVGRIAFHAFASCPWEALITATSSSNRELGRFDSVVDVDEDALSVWGICDSSASIIRASGHSIRASATYFSAFSTADWPGSSTCCASSHTILTSRRRVLQV